MALPDHNVDTAIPTDEIRVALERIAASSRFRELPQMVSFLRYVVEQTLAGKDEQIKGYTIAVEALGRDASFDPGSQSIVRTEAARLRRELARYYAEAGADDPIRIELPLGRYVPEFQRRSTSSATAIADDPPSSTVVENRFGWLLRPTPIPPIQIAGLTLIVVVAYWLLDVLVLDHWITVRGPIVTSAPSRPAPLERSRHGEPRISIAPVEVSDTPDTDRPIDLAGLRDRLVEAFSRFEDVVVVAPKSGGDVVTKSTASVQADYVITPTLALAPSGAMRLRVRIDDTSDQSLLLQETFEAPAAAFERGAARDELVARITTWLLQPFGVIPTAERHKFKDNASPTPYQCVLDAMDIGPQFDRDRHAKARKCVDQVVADDPGYAYAYVAAARVHLVDAFFGLSSPQEALSRAFSLARQGVEMAPRSARAHVMLMQALVLRGLVREGLTMGEQAIALNPYDLRVLMQYGTQVLTTGDVDRGLRYLQDARKRTSALPLSLVWGLFLGSYLKGDLETAEFCVDHMTGQLEDENIAAALLAAKKGDVATVQAALARLPPTWSSSTAIQRARLSRLIPSTEIVDRLVADIAQAAAMAAK